MSYLPNTDPTIESLLSNFHTYAHARATFLMQINMPTSCRDPLAEFSEVLVLKLLRGTLPPSRVQKGYDLVTPDMRRVQVKYLANPSQKWINEHHVYFTDDTDDYALVIYTQLTLESVVIFARETIGKVGLQLKKLHPDQERSLQFTKRNYTSIIANEALFRSLGVKVYQFNVAG